MEIRRPACFHTRPFEDAWYWQDAQEVSSVAFFQSFEFHDSGLLDICLNAWDQRLIVVSENDTYWNRTRLPLDAVAPYDNVFVLLKFEHVDHISMTGDFGGNVGFAESRQLTSQICETIFWEDGKLCFRHAEKIQVVCLDSQENRLKILAFPSAPATNNATEPTGTAPRKHESDEYDVTIPLAVTPAQLAEVARITLNAPNGKRVSVKLPEDFREGMQLRLPGYGREGKGDLYLRLHRLPEGVVSEQ